MKAGRPGRAARALLQALLSVALTSDPHPCPIAYCMVEATAWKPWEDELLRALPWDENSTESFASLFANISDRFGGRRTVRAVHLCIFESFVCFN